jgi:hypothetical protein
MDTVTVLSTAPLQGLRAGEVGTLERTAEVDALIANGRLLPVGEDAHPKRGRTRRERPAEVPETADVAEVPETEVAAPDSDG